MTCSFVCENNLTLMYSDYKQIGRVSLILNFVSNKEFALYLEIVFKVSHSTVSF